MTQSIQDGQHKVSIKELLHKTKAVQRSRSHKFAVTVGVCVFVSTNISYDDINRACFSTKFFTRNEWEGRKKGTRSELKSGMLVKLEMFFSLKYILALPDSDSDASLRNKMYASFFMLLIYFEVSFLSIFIHGCRTKRFKDIRSNEKIVEKGQKVECKKWHLKKYLFSVL